MPKVPISEQDRKKSYFKYYQRALHEAAEERYQQAAKGPMDNGIAHRIQDRETLFEPGYLPGEFGWWTLDDGTALVANLTAMPGVTGEMFDWWFAWHPMDRLRYAIWDSEDHADVYLEDPARAYNMDLSARERHWGSIHHVWEDVGLGSLDLLDIYFKRPSELGYDEEKIGTPACCALVCANCCLLGNDEREDITIVMTHFLRPIEGGSELRSRFWYGYKIIDGACVRTLPEGARIPDVAPKALLDHNIKEFTNLAAILPAVYAEEKDRWGKPSLEGY